MLRLLPLMMMGCVYGQEINLALNHITAAVCQLETGTTWIGPGSVSGRYILGRDGETGPWQAMPYTVTALARSVQCNHSSVHYAETTFRLWYARLLSKHGTHAEALAAYHKGSAGRHKANAKDYATRAMNLAQRLARESRPVK